MRPAPNGVQRGMANSKLVRSNCLAMPKTALQVLETRTRMRALPGCRHAESRDTHWYHGPAMVGWNICPQRQARRDILAV